MAKDTGKIKIWVKDLKKHFQTENNPIAKLITGGTYVKAVDGVNFEVREGEVFGLVGESGSGKTTVGENILLLQTPTEGDIYYDIDENIKKKIEWAEREDDQEGLEKLKEKYDLTKKKNLKSMRKDIQIIFQDPSSSLNPSMTIYEMIAHPVKIHDMTDSKEEEKEIVHNIMEEVGLSPPSRFVDVYPSDLSGGQQQRVVIARAMVLNPDFIVADEPVAMLDMSIRAKILDLLMDLKEEFGLTFLLITHDLTTVKFVSDRIAIMYLGKIMEIGDVEDIFEDPKHPYTETLLATIPRADPRKSTERRKLAKGEIPDPINMPRGCRFHPRCLKATPNCGWSPIDLENYINENLLDIYEEEEIEELELDFGIDEEKNTLIIPKNRRVW
ncbi:MAG: ABC transporter ATP-binding protein [Candidatus Saliniplasma sp.]